ncbi:uncharacterized protein LOC123514962 isoform X2 [Portunus trituberculatus]|uniref:uncharacterized protein LOC123514962 isoform X2 n=1 Tax=Portunus trituberculatus TaxID=210409 RepID=UPI001E1CD9E4|nr:uncharacterized protein LOC123514962 isoform X2 [Portunus trituberculatus]
MTRHACADVLEEWRSSLGLPAAAYLFSLASACCIILYPASIVKLWVYAINDCTRLYNCRCSREIAKPSVVGSCLHKPVSRDAASCWWSSLHHHRKYQSAHPECRGPGRTWSSLVSLHECSSTDGLATL